MKKVLTTSIAALAVAGSLTLAAPAADASSGSACQQRTSSRSLTVIGLTGDQKIVCFREDRPGRIRSAAPIQNLVGDSRLIGIDHRPATGALYGLGDAGGIYTVDPSTGYAVKVAQSTLALSGTAFGVDFNPVVDRLRVVSDNGQNLRINVDTGEAAADANLNTGPNQPVSGVTAAAYTNNDADPTTATTLFDIDTTADRVAIQAPPASGTLGPTGSLGVDATGDAGFDIYSRVQQGVTVNVRALAALNTGGTATLYRVDLLTGRVSGQGKLGADIVDLAIPS